MFNTVKTRVGAAPSAAQPRRRVEFASRSRAAFSFPALGMAAACLAAAGLTLVAGSDGLAAQKSKAGKKAVKQMTDATAEGLYLALDLSEDANESFAHPIGKGPIKVGAVPFRLPQGEHDNLSLRQAQWNGWEKDFPWSYESPAPREPHDPQMPVLKAPVADYVAAHVLAIADDDPETTPAFTLRMGTFGAHGNLLYMQRDFAARAPRRSEAAGGGTPVKTAGDILYYVRVPTTFAFAQDMKPDSPMAIEVTKEVRLARRSPDPTRFRYRPLGLPSGVRIAAMTLEKSPLQMRVESDEMAHAFVQPQTPTFKVTLTNISPETRSYTLKFEAVHLKGAKIEAARSGEVEAGKTAEISVPLDVPVRGYYDLSVSLEDGNRQPLLRRVTSFALLPPDTRQHRDQSPFGTYDYGGLCYTCGSAKTGPLYVKLGMHYGIFGNLPDVRKQYGLVKANEPGLGGAKSVNKYNAVLEKNPDLPPMALIFHETTLSGKHTERVPDLFTDRTYILDAEESERIKDLIATGVAAAEEMRRAHPEVKLALGNDALPTKEELLRNHYPADAFDSLGNENGSFGHPPESQPPDWLGNNSSLWMDRQMLDAYGYKDKPVTECHEVCYPSTNPGNLSYQTQADYFVRHALHSVAWEIPAFRPGVLMDTGDTYRWGAWGSSGFCHTFPEMNVKPAFVAFATMSLMLDGAKFVAETPLGSPSLYGVEFTRPDGSRLFALWTLRGERPVTFSVEGEGAWRMVDDQANESSLKPADGKLTVKLSPSPVYLIGKSRLAAASPGEPVYDDKPDGTVSKLAALDSLDDWTVETGRSMELEYFGFMTPRRKGDFAFEAVPAFEGSGPAIRVTPKPLPHVKDTLAMPMYAVLAHKKGIELPGTPTEIGLWINGNSGWGRVIFDLTDASGQRWISIGAQQHDGKRGNPAEFKLPADVLSQFPSPAISDWNTEDAWGLSRINFDGWRYVGYPLPGNYPGEHYGWAANSQWRSEKDREVHYPLTLKKLVVELNEKTLRLKTYAPVPRPEIYIKDLVAAQGDTVRLKQSVDDYDPRYQIK